MTFPSKRSDKQRAATLKEEGKEDGRWDLGLEVGNLGISPDGVVLSGESWAKAPVGDGRKGCKEKLGYPTLVPPEGWECCAVFLGLWR